MFIGKHIFINFLSLFVIRNFRSMFLKVDRIAPLAAILRRKEAIRPKGEIAGNKKKGAKMLNHK